MKQILIPFMALVYLLAAPRPAGADPVLRLVKELQSNPSYKVRLTAVLGLSKFADPRAAAALTDALKKDSEDPKVRGFAAMALGRLRVEAAVPALQKAARASDPFLKSKAMAALETLCPSKLAGKRLYLNLDRFKASGPSANLAKSIVLIQLARAVGERADVTTGWPACKKPTARDLGGKRIKGFFLDTNVKVTSEGGKVGCHVNVLFTTYPDQSIKGNAGAKASVPGAPDGEVLSGLIEALVGAIKSDISRFLDTQ